MQNKQVRVSQSPLKYGDSGGLGQIPIFSENLKGDWERSLTVCCLFIFLTCGSDDFDIRSGTVQSLQHGLAANSSCLWKFQVNPQSFESCRWSLKQSISIQ